MGDTPVTRALPSHSFVRFNPGAGDARATVYQYRVVVEEGPDRGKSQLIQGRLVVGTHENAEFRLTDSTVSRFHLELVAQPDGVRGRDLGSFNGTFTAGARVREFLVPKTARVQTGTTVLRITRENEQPMEEPGLDAYGPLVGISPAARQIFSLLTRLESGHTTLLLQGESGTGKELVARTVHQRSGRRGPFVVVDCAALDAGLAESDLFGHAEGAFTGATQAREGAFQRAQGGTLFLDEVGELAPELQPKLLRVLEARSIRPVGADAEQPVDVRIIAATQHKLEENVARGTFRSDLFFRLAVVFLTLPPLRERREDIPLLANHFARELGGPDLQLPLSELQRWRKEAWPGNARELRNAVERLAASQARTTLPPPRRTSEPFKEAKERFTREYLGELLRRHGGQVAPAAAEAGLGRTYLYALLKKAGLLKE